MQEMLLMQTFIFHFRHELVLARASLLLDETKASKQFMFNYFTLAFKCHKKISSEQLEGMIGSCCFT